jgi:hypothetical protein
VNPLNEKRFIDELLALRKQDPAAFAEMVLSALKNHPDLAVSDSAPAAKKSQAISQLIEHFVGLEKYEDCAFLLDLKKKIEDEKED